MIPIMIMIILLPKSKKNIKQRNWKTGKYVKNKIEMGKKKWEKNRVTFFVSLHI